MALEIMESTTKEPWSTKRCIIYAIISLLLGAIIFTFAYIGMNQHTGLGTFNKSVLSWIVDHRQTQTTEIAKYITMIAEPIILASIASIIAIVWAIINREIWRPILLTATVGGAMVSSLILKALISNDRPAHDFMIKPFETGYSFPSGHTICIMVLLSIIGYLICSRHSSSCRTFSWIVVVKIGVIVIAVSRLYLGYHWITDVVASIGLGFIILAIAIFADRIVSRRLED